MPNSAWPWVKLVISHSFSFSKASYMIFSYVTAIVSKKWEIQCNLLYITHPILVHMVAPPYFCSKIGCQIEEVFFREHFSYFPRTTPNHFLRRILQQHCSVGKESARPGWNGLFGVNLKILLSSSLSLIIIIM